MKVKKDKNYNKSKIFVDAHHYHQFHQHIDWFTMKLSVSAYRAHASAHKKILSSSYQTQHYGSTAASQSHPSSGLFSVSVESFVLMLISCLDT